MEGIEPLLKHNWQVTRPATIKKAFQSSIERITAELTEGFRFFSDSQKLNAVAIFGSGSFSADNPHYQEARKLSELLAKENFSIITGGGPGIMEAANRGAVEGKGQSIGLNIRIPKGQDYNQYVKSGLSFDYFFVRKLMFAVSCHAYVFFPGGFGTLDEFFEIVNLISNKKLKMPPVVVAIGRDYWQPLFDWLKNNVGEKHKAIGLNDMDAFHLVSTGEQALEIIKNFRQR